MVLQLCGKSGLLQNIAAGDSILAPMGRAWCQLAADADAASPSKELAVLKLLVPGTLPHEAELYQQGD